MSQHMEGKEPVSEEHDTPVLKIFVVCDTLLRDKVTDQVSIVGIRDKIKASGFPCEYCLSAFARLTEAPRIRTVRLDLMSLSDMSRWLVVEHMTVKGPTLDPLGFFVLDVRDQRVVFPKAGDYELLLSANGNTLGGHRLRVSLPMTAVAGLGSAA